MKHMNAEKFNFFLYIILNELNKIKLNGKFSNIIVSNFSHISAIKRPFNEIE